MTKSSSTRAPRSMLFVPATRWDVIIKAAASEADSICVDLEDSVPTDAKEKSRSNVVRAFAEPPLQHGSDDLRTCLIRARIHAQSRSPTLCFQGQHCLSEAAAQAIGGIKRMCAGIL